MADTSIRKNATAPKNNIRKSKRLPRKFNGRKNLLYAPLEMLLANVENFLENVEKWKTFVEKWKTIT